MDIYQELNTLRKFKSDVEETCSAFVVIEKLNSELETERNKLNTEINELKNTADDYEKHINHIYDDLCLTILFSLETELFNFGASRFNLCDKCQEFVSSKDIIEILKKKLVGLIKVHNTENNNYTFYYHKSDEDSWFILDDPLELIHYENMIDLVCPAFNTYYTECPCNRCVHNRSIVEQNFIEEDDIELQENDFDY